MKQESVTTLVDLVQTTGVERLGVLSSGKTTNSARQAASTTRLSNVNGRSYKLEKTESFVAEVAQMHNLFFLKSFIGQYSGGYMKKSDIWEQKQSST